MMMIAPVYYDVVMMRHLWLCGVLLASACGEEEGSGLVSSKLLIELSASELMQLCSYTAEITGAPRTVTCEDEEIELDGAAECISLYSQLTAECPATVANAEACAEAQNDNPCQFSVQACGVFYNCM